jgi:hypothetical protein
MTQESYSREGAVAAVRSFYEFFTTLPSLDPEDTRYPPPSGWAGIDEKSMAGLKKNQDVTELLKHLPYMPWEVQIAYQTHTINYTSIHIQDDIQKGRLEGFILPVGAGVIPEHVVPLTMGGRYGSTLLLDTQEGKPPAAGNQCTADKRVRHRHRLHPDGTTGERSSTEG